MSNYRVYGTTKENGVLTGNLVIVYKADRSNFGSAGEELGRATATADGVFEVQFDDWPYEVFVVAIDLTPGVKYAAIIKDWVIGEYIGADPYFDDVKSLLHMEGTNGATNFIDVVGNSVVPVGDANTSTTTAQFGGSSLALDGVGDRIEIAYNPAYAIDTLSFCVECWVYQTNNSGYQNISTRRNVANDPSARSTWIVRVLDGILQVYLAEDSNTWRSDPTSGTVPLNQWVHIAIAREGTTCKVFMGGVQTGTITSIVSVLDSSNPILIGSESDETNFFAGYIDEFRFTVGTPRYTQNFIPPSSPFQSVTGDIYFNYVTSLLHMEGSSGGTSFIDEVGHTVTPVGQTNTTAVNWKFGTTSAAFDGTGDYLSIAYDPSMNLGSKDFTIECWAYIDVPTQVASQTICTTRPVGSGYYSFLIWCKSRDIYFYLKTGTSGWTSGIIYDQIDASNWHHIALSREGGRLRGFIDGVKGLDIAITLPVIGDTNDVLLGAHGDGTFPLLGNLDEFRMTVGYARYTDDFTIPASAFPNA